MVAVAIRGNGFELDGIPANSAKSISGIPIDGLLINSRMINGAFDDANPQTMFMWKYPDTGIWDPDRNNREFIAQMAIWKADGLDAFTVGVQGGSPQGYSTSQPWDNAGFTRDGKFLNAYKTRLGKIIDEADRLGMVVILCIFYHGQDHRLNDETAIKKAIGEVCEWVLDNAWGNVLIEIANEVNWASHYTHEVIKHPRVHELIAHAKAVTKSGKRLLVSTSFLAAEPYVTNEVLREADFVLVHGNGTPYPERLREMVQSIRAMSDYRGQPIMFNEDDHFDFEKPENNMKSALAAGASWGFFDPGSKTVFPPEPTIGDYVNGYQAVPINWSKNTENKKAFFHAIQRDPS